MPKCRELIAFCNDAVEWKFDHAFANLKSMRCCRGSPMIAVFREALKELRVKEV